MARRPVPLVAALALLAALLVFQPRGADAWTRPPVRIAGADRYDTAARISTTFFHDAKTVVLASGEAFPDALSAGPLAALRGGPVLTTQRDALPDATRNELTRLMPTKVYVVGGPAAVSDGVVDQVAMLLNLKPVRLAGADRYATAVKVASLFPQPVNTAFLASGKVFADALAGGAGAAIKGSPLLLTPTDALPASVHDALAKMAPSETLVLGGTGAIADAVVTALPGPSRRLAGNDRYATAALIAEEVAPAASQVVVATGNEFPDALAAAPMAGAADTPLLLTSGCMPDPTLSVIREQSWRDITVVGGTAAVPEFGLSRPCAVIPDGEFAPGFTLETRVAAGPTVIRLVGITRTAGWAVRATTATGKLTPRMYPTDIARRLGSRVVINGSFFLESGEPTYALAVDGRLIKAPGAGGTLFGIDPTRPKRTFVVEPDFDITIDGHKVDKVNSGAPGGGELEMFTPEYNRVINVGERYCRASLTRVRDMALDSAGIPTQLYEVADESCDSSSIDASANDTVAALEGTPEGDVIESFVVGDRMDYRWSIAAGVTGVTEVMGGHSRFVKDSQVATDVSLNHGPFYDERAPRTVLCQMPSGSLIFVVVDGRQPGYSVGWTPRETADFLVGIGCADAVNLDGGGSSALVIDGVLANRPSDRTGQRGVGTAMYISPTSPTP